MRLCTRILHRLYRDSVALMGVQERLRLLPGIREAGVVMGTQANLGILRQVGLWTDSLAEAIPDDLVVVLAVEDGADGEAALKTAADWLTRPSHADRDEGPAHPGQAPRTLDTALRADPDANLALISLPGRYASVEAFRALDRGLNVLLFSDNIPVADEIELKETADRLGLLCLGPDCGTAVIDGCGLGFANVLRRGPVGLAGASGTGIQELGCALERHGLGVSHALGTGGRDIEAEVGARATLAALNRLQADPATEVLAVVAKHAHPDLAAALSDACRKPVVFCFLGQPDGPTLSSAACSVAELAARPRRRPGRGAVRGLFSGGTLANEAERILAAWLGEPIARTLEAPGHAVVDLGDDRYTQGRLHPMIDYALRTQLLRETLQAAGTACALLDVVLGVGAHPDPASALEPAIRGARVPVVVALCGSEGDPQGLADQRRRLSAAGARVESSNAAAARLAARLAQGEESAERPPLLGRPLRVVNLGLERFAQDLARQGVPVTHASWQAPAGGDPEVADLLRRLI